MDSSNISSPSLENTLYEYSYPLPCEEEDKQTASMSTVEYSKDKCQTKKKLLLHKLDSPTSQTNQEGLPQEDAMNSEPCKIKKQKLNNGEQQKKNNFFSQELSKELKNEEILNENDQEENEDYQQIKQIERVSSESDDSISQNQQNIEIIADTRVKILKLKQKINKILKNIFSSLETDVSNSDNFNENQEENQSEDNKEKSNELEKNNMKQDELDEEIDDDQEEDEEDDNGDDDEDYQITEGDILQQRRDQIMNSQWQDNTFQKLEIDDLDEPINQECDIEGFDIDEVMQDDSKKRYIENLMECLPPYMYCINQEEKKQFFHKLNKKFRKNLQSDNNLLNHSHQKKVNFDFSQAQLIEFDLNKKVKNISKLPIRPVTMQPITAD